MVKVGDWVYSHEQFVSTTSGEAISRGNHSVTLDCGRKGGGVKIYRDIRVAGRRRAGSGEGE